MPRICGERLLDRVSPVFGREEQLDRLEQALEDASDPNKPKQIVFVYGQSGLSTCRLVEMALGVFHRQSGGERASVLNQTITESNVTTNHYPRRRLRQSPPCPCWYGFGKFTKQQEEKPFTELSRSIAEIVTQQLLPEFQRVSGATEGAAVGTSASTSDPSFCDMKSFLRKRLTVGEVDILIQFCPEVEQLHLYSTRERAVGQTKRVAKDTTLAVTDFMGRGMAFVAPSFFHTPAGPSSFVDCENVDASTTVNATIDTPSNQLRRLKYVVKLFLRALSERRPVVWVLDDIQYAIQDGLSSLSFVQFILNDLELKQFFFCGIVRDDSESKMEVKALGRWLDEVPSPTELRLGNMKEDDIRAMLFELLRLDIEDLGSLASLIYQRTQGNDYFVFEMINFLQKEDIIYFSTEIYQWRFDIDEAKRKTMVSDNVLAFVEHRLRQLPISVQRCLQYAAFLGYRFDEDLLVRVIRADFAQSHRDMKENELEIGDLLRIAVEEGFVERLSYPNVARYQFVHVEIQTECEHLINEGGKLYVDKLHWNIGAALWRGWRNLESFEKIENRIIFPCVKELNSGRHAYKTSEFTLGQLVRLNQEAARRSYNLHAYFPAATYLETAMSLMGRQAWIDDYELSLQLHTSLAQMYLASGQVNKIPYIVRVVGERAKSFQDRLPVDLVDLTRCKMLGELDLHVQKSISLLNLLGVSLRGDYFWFQTERMKKRVKEALASLSDEQILEKAASLPDEAFSTIEHIEQGLIHTLVFSVKYKSYLKEEYRNLETAAACKMVEGFFKERKSRENSAVCLTLAACLFCESDYDTKALRRMLKWVTCSKDQADLALSIRLAELALKLPRTENEIRTMTVVSLARHWRYPLPNCAEVMLKSYNIGMQRYELCRFVHFSRLFANEVPMFSGDLRTAASAAFGYIQMYLFSGLPLTFLEKDVDNILSVMIDYW
jgi:hypothetical protein